MLLKNLGVTSGNALLLGSLPALAFEALLLAFRA
jgi:hypothetical protein